MRTLTRWSLDTHVWIRDAGVRSAYDRTPGSIFALRVTWGDESVTLVLRWPFVVVLETAPVIAMLIRMLWRR